jgi:hypothetical protein
MAIVDTAATALRAGPAAPPREFAIEGIAPNPALGGLVVRFTLPRSAPIRLSVFDLQGREVAVLAAAEFAAGRHRLEWNAMTRAGRAPAGVYFVCLGIPGTNLIQRITLLR